VNALFTALVTYGEDYPALFTDLRRAFPVLDVA
jgi:hypothetical protein